MPHSSPNPCPSPKRVSRREMIEIGSSLTLELGLTDLIRAEARAAAASSATARARRRVRPQGQVAPTADSCILIFLNGGPSHLDMWDMKPDAPAEIRGEFRPIASSLPGVQVSEHLPQFARQLHLGTLIRSAHHSVNNSHGAAVYTGLTGHDRGEVGGRARPTDNPAIGSVVGLHRPPETGIVPFVAMPYITAEGAGDRPSLDSSAAGSGERMTHSSSSKIRTPPTSRWPSSPHPAGVDLARFANRRRLDTELGTPDGYERDTRFRDADGFRARAYDLLTAPTTQEAFRIDREDPRVRDRYGRNIYGQSVLLARRLVEAGVRVASISWAPDANATWDTHGNNFNALKSTLLPQLDAALSSLLDDLQAPGPARPDPGRRHG